VIEVSSNQPSGSRFLISLPKSMILKPSNSEADAA